MILTIGQYIEALTNSEGRFRTLGKVYPVKDSSRHPVLAMPGHGLVDFEVMAGDVRYTLRCPLRNDAESAGNLRVLYNREKGLDSSFFTEWDMLEKEIVLFDAVGKPFEVGILARVSPQGEKADAFLQRVASAGNTEAVVAALKSFGELTAWAEDRECGGIAARKLLVAPDGNVMVTGFSANDESPVAALAFFFTAAMPGRFADIGLPLISGSASARPPAGKLCAAAADAGFPEPSQILAGDVAGAVRKLGERTIAEISALGAKLSETLGAPEDNTHTAGYSLNGDDGDGVKCVRDGGGWRYVDRLNRPVIDTVWLSAVPFREGRAEVETKTGKGLIDRDGRTVVDPVYEELAWDEYWGLVSVMSEGHWSLLDRDGMLLTNGYYDWIGECSEGLILAQKDGKCGFLNVEGRETVPFLYDDATSFSGGCSFVTCDSENFFIDSKGRCSCSDS